MILPIGIKVSIENGDGQSLTASIGKKGTVAGYLGPFVKVMIEGVGLRLSLPEYVQPYPYYD